MSFVELYQYIQIKTEGRISGDFQTEKFSNDTLELALVLSILGWWLVFALVTITKTKDEPRDLFWNGWWVILVFIANLVITYATNIGSAITPSVSKLSILTTIIPLNYLILVIGRKGIKIRFLITSFMFIAIDLYRVLLGAIFEVFYIYCCLVTKKILILFVMLMPLLFYMGNEIVIYKYETRGMRIFDAENILLKTTTARIASTLPLAYGLSNIEELAEQCHNEDYASQYEAALLAVIPKRIFGIEWVKTYNNCLIEQRLGRKVEESGVNSPLILNVIIAISNNFIKGVGYLLFILSLIILIIKISNYCFGNESDLYKYWVIFQYIWTGNILGLMIPLYFLLLISLTVIYNKK